MFIKTLNINLCVTLQFRSITCREQQIIGSNNMITSLTSWFLKDQVIVPPYFNLLSLAKLNTKQVIDW